MPSVGSISRIGNKTFTDRRATAGMVRSLLGSSLLQRYATLRFGLMLLGVSILLASVPVWLGTADFDYHYSFDRERTELSFEERTQTAPYRQLTGETEQRVDAALDGKTYNFEDDTVELPEFVRRDGTTYEFDARRTVDWTNPGSFVPVVVGLVGLWLTIEAVQHERQHLGPYGH